MTCDYILNKIVHNTFDGLNPLLAKADLGYDSIKEILCTWY